jgi:hypothetical protein
MLPSEADFAALASEIAARCADAVEKDAVDTVPDDALGQALASLVRLFAAKAQAGPTPRPFARNSGIAPTDVMVVASAMLDATGLNVFELGAWQAMSRVAGWRKRESVFLRGRSFPARHSP